jgi:two-component system nitrogen regulation response regulator GlnG
MTTDSIPKTAREPSASTEDGIMAVARLVGEMLSAGENDIYRRVQTEVERTVLLTALRFTKGNQVQASESLGISRTTLRSKLRHLRISIVKEVLLKTSHSC